MNDFCVDLKTPAVFVDEPGTLTCIMRAATDVSLQENASEMTRHDKFFRMFACFWRVHDNYTNVKCSRVIIYREGTWHARTLSLAIKANECVISRTRENSIRQRTSALHGTHYKY